MKKYPCDYQIDSSESGLYYCVNGSVIASNNIVTDSICKNCPHKNATPIMLRQRIPKEDVDKILDGMKNEKNSPPLSSQINNAIAAVKDTYNSLISGIPLLVPGDVGEARWAICKTCEYRKENTCTLCGCNLKAKTKLSSQECPAGRWGPELKDKAQDKPDTKTELPGKPKWAD